MKTRQFIITLSLVAAVGLLLFGVGPRQSKGALRPNDVIWFQLSTAANDTGGRIHSVFLCLHPDGSVTWQEAPFKR
jgi:hypothetical protein